MASNSSDSDNESYDSTLSDPDYARPPRPRRRSTNQKTVRSSVAIRRRSAGIRKPNARASSSSSNATGIVKRRRSRRPPKARADNGEDRQRSNIERRRKRRPRTMNKRTVLYWMISLGVVQENEAISYIDAESGKKLREGEVNGDGILCKCCYRRFTVGEFEIHCRRATMQPYQNIVLAESKRSLLDCQKRAWETSNEVDKRAFNNKVPKTTTDQENDDSCLICAEGGYLICCERCPSVVHPNCIPMENMPQGDWLCSYCVCNYCGGSDGRLHKCVQCEKRWHGLCGEGYWRVNSKLTRFFCGSDCRMIHQRLKNMIGVRNDLRDGLSWTPLQRIDEPLTGSEAEIYNKVQINSKLAVAWLVMDECFSPVKDRHTRVDFVQNIVYNRECNLTPRVDFRGFYTIVLERNEEIIGVASIRVHGKMLAEMPFIGIRSQYWRRGMGRILENSVEFALRTLQVENLVIPSMERLEEMWTQTYYFSRMEEDQQLMDELSQYKMVMFPNVVRLIKHLGNAA
ncbi:hypothetical protein DITRI_Ditri07aG0158400 [Diplodiscus trichospermus]